MMTASPKFADEIRILIIDDDEAMRRSMERLLQLERKYRVRSLGEAGWGLELVKAWRPQLVVLDTRMIGVDGLEILTGIRGDADLRDIRVVVVSGSVQEHQKQQMLDAGADAFFEKPFDSRAFADAIAGQIFGGGPLNDPDAGAPA